NDWGDNSNTQFANLALWVARRHDMPVNEALLRVERRYRQTQRANGSWAYEVEEDHGTATMTCAGLLGLAVGHGVYHDLGKVKDFRKDQQLLRGLASLSSVIGNPVAEAGQVPNLGKAGRSYYFLWTLERMAIIYGLDKINNKDWYAWGAQLLVHNQQGDGNWNGEFHQAGVDTCFALLFLKRANIAPELADVMRKKNKQLDKLPDLSIIISKDPVKSGIEGGGNKQPSPPDELDDPEEVAAAARQRAPAYLPRPCLTSRHDDLGDQRTWACTRAVRA